MGSVFAQLLDTLPFHLALSKVEERTGNPFLQASAGDVRSCIERLPSQSAHRQPLPAVSSGADSHTQRLWSYAQGSPLHHVTGVHCRARDYAYQAFEVFDRIEWGVASGSTVEPKVQVADRENRWVDIPLTADFLHSRWLLKDGYAGESSHWLWPLEATLDTGIVLAFACELAEESHRLVARPYAANRDPESAAAIEQLAAGGGQPGWGALAVRGDFMPTRSRRDAPSAEVGERVTGRASGPRVLVIVSFATMRERADFDPGGIAGMAKVFPQILVKASIPLSQVKGAIKMVRPARSSIVAPDGQRTVSEYCGGNPESMIRPLLVTDTNNAQLPGGLSPPFWSELFAYYDDDWSRIGGERLHVVKRDVRRRREERFGTRRIPLRTAREGAVRIPRLRTILGTEPEMDTILKEPHQGEFDNIHVAPVLRLEATHYAFPAVGGPMNCQPISDRAAFFLDRISMAPFCSHDCLHTHWRWGTRITVGQRYAMGWSDERPHATPGAPMVPRNQDVWLTMTARNEMLYEARALGEVAEPIPAFAWQVMNHHGSGFVSGIAAPGPFGAARTAVYLESIVGLYGPGTLGLLSLLNPVTSSAALYWHLRYTFANGRPVERLSLFTDELRRARNL